MVHQFANSTMAMGFTCGAEWGEFDLDNALWIIPTGRMKMKAEHVVPLARQALAILAELKEISCGSRFVFSGRNRDKPISNNTMLFTLYRLGYKGKMTGHGFRAVASTIRSLKSELGLRPVYHSKEVRSDGHLFITVLAYQTVQVLRARLKEAGITQSWAGLRETLIVQRRVTSSFQQRDGRTLNVRKSTQA